jgi:DNA repair exonuclease SbcCD ATPase subunit
MKIENKPTINKKVDYRVLSIQLQGELDGKADQTSALELRIANLEEQVQVLQTENDELKIYKETEESTSVNTQESLSSENEKVDIAQFEAMNQDMLKKKEEEFIAKRKEDLKKFKQMHSELMVKKEQEYKTILEDADKLILEQEKEIESLQRKIKDYESEIQEFEESYNEAEREKEELNSRIIEMNQENDDIKQALEMQRFDFENSKQDLAKRVAAAHQEHENKMKKLKKKYILDKGNKIRELDREWTLKWEKKKNELELLSIKKEIEDFFMNFDSQNDQFKSEIKNSCLKLIKDFYSQQEQQNTIIGLKSQLKQVEQEDNKLRHKYEDLTDENDNLIERIQKIDEILEQQRDENEQEAKEIEYDNEQRKIMDSYENLLKSKDITITSLENKMLKVEQRIKNRLNMKVIHLDDGIVLLKNKQTLLVQEIVKNVEDSLIK